MGTFKDSLKKWFFQQGSKTPTSSTLIPTIDGASGNNQGFPNGYTTMANLASAMGDVNLLRTYNFSLLNSKIEINTSNADTKPTLTLLISMQKTNSGIINKALYLMMGYGQMTEGRTMHYKLYGDLPVTIEYSPYKATISFQDTGMWVNILQIGGSPLTITGS